MTRYLAPILLAAVAMTAVLIGGPAARADATIVSSTVENSYPKQLSFKLTAQAPANITDVTLSYTLAGAGVGAIAKPSDFTAGKSVSVEAVIQTGSSSNYVPVGSEFVYHWEITTDDGKTTTGPENRFFFMPPAQDWQTVKSDLVVVYFHGNQQAAAEAFVKAIAETYDKMGKNLLNTSLKLLPIKAIYFSSESEMNEATLSRGSTFDQAVISCGQRPAGSNDIIFLNPARCGSTDQTDTLRHEFTHLLTKSAAGGDRLPAWLDEGTAVTGQTEPGQGYVSAYLSAARANRLIPFAQMVSPANDARLVDVFYGQAYMMVKYLIDRGGPAKFAELYATIKQGKRFDDALVAVYGFDVPGFEKQFLAAAGGSSPQTTPTAAPTARPQPTVRPTAVPQPQTTVTKDNGGDGISRGMLIGIGIAVLFGLLAVFAYLFSQMLANNRRRTVGSPPAGDESPRPPTDWSHPDGG
jgi:hypothetical protein